MVKEQDLYDIIIADIIKRTSKATNSEFKLVDSSKTSYYHFTKRDKNKFYNLYRNVGQYSTRQIDMLKIEVDCSTISIYVMNSQKSNLIQFTIEDPNCIDKLNHFLTVGF